jgi:hypothetical protein
MSESPKKKQPYRKEDNQISFRVSYNDYIKIEDSAKAFNLSVAAYSKKKIKGSRMTYPKIDREGAKTIALELRRIGSNVNQIAKHLNQGGRTSKDELEGIQKELKEIWLTLSDQLEK